MVDEEQQDTEVNNTTEIAQKVKDQEKGFKKGKKYNVAKYNKVQLWEDLINGESEFTEKRNGERG